METFSEKDTSKTIQLRLSDLDSDCGTSISRKAENPFCVVNNSSKNRLILPATKMISSEKFWEKQQQPNIEVNSSNLSKFEYHTKKSVAECGSSSGKYPVEIRMWSVNLNGNVLTVQGMTPGGEHIKRQVRKRISSYIFTDNNNKICSLTGPQDISKMPRIKPYIQFDSGIPENWKSICQIASDNFFLKPVLKSKFTNKIEYKNSHTELMCSNKLGSTRITLTKNNTGISQPENLENHNRIADKFGECKYNFTHMNKRQHEIYVKNYLKKKIEKYQAMYNATLARCNLDSDDSIVTDFRILENRPSIIEPGITEEKNQISFRLDNRRAGAHANVNWETSSKSKSHLNKKANIKKISLDSRKYTLSQDSESYLENSSYSSSESVQNKRITNNNSKLLNLNSQTEKKESVAVYQESDQNLLKVMNSILPTDNFKAISFHQNKTLEKNREHSNSIQNNSVYSRKLEEIDEVITQYESDCEDINENSSNSSVDIKNLFQKSTSQNISNKQVSSKQSLDFVQTNFNPNQMRKTSTPNIKKQSNVNDVLTKKKVNTSLHATHSNSSNWSKYISSRDAKNQNMKRKKKSTARKYTQTKYTEPNINSKQPEIVCTNSSKQNDTNSDVISKDNLSVDTDCKQNLKPGNRSCKTILCGMLDSVTQNTLTPEKYQHCREIHESNYECQHSDDCEVSNDINYTISQNKSRTFPSKGLLFYQDESTDEILNAKNKLSSEGNFASPKMHVLDKLRVTRNRQTMLKKIPIESRDKGKENSPILKKSPKVQIHNKPLNNSSDQEIKSNNVYINEPESKYPPSRKQNSNSKQSISEIPNRAIPENMNLTKTVTANKTTPRKIVYQNSKIENTNCDELTNNETAILTAASSTRSQKFLRKSGTNIPKKMNIDEHALNRTIIESEKTLFSHSSAQNNQSKKNNFRNSKKNISLFSDQSTSNCTDKSNIGNVSVSKRGRNRCSSLPFWLGARLFTNEKETHVKCASSIKQLLLLKNNTYESKKEISELIITPTEKSVQDNKSSTCNEKVLINSVGKKRDGYKNQTENILNDMENDIQTYTVFQKDVASECSNPQNSNVYNTIEPCRHSIRKCKPQKKRNKQTESLPDNSSDNAPEEGSKEKIWFEEPGLPLQLMCKHDKSFLDSLMESSVVFNSIINKESAMYNSSFVKNISAENRKYSADTNNDNGSVILIDEENMKERVHLTIADLKTKTPLKKCCDLPRKILRKGECNKSITSLKTARKLQGKFDIKECHVLLSRDDLSNLKQKLRNENVNKNKYKNCNRANLFQEKISWNLSSRKRLATKIKYPNTFQNRMSYLQPTKCAAKKSVIAESTLLDTRPYVEADEHSGEKKSGKRKLFSQKEWSKSELFMEIRDSPVRTFKINLNTVRQECDEDAISEVSALAKK